MYKSVFLRKMSGFLQSFGSSFIIAALTVLSVLTSFDVNAQGNLLIIPRRVVFEGNKKAQQLTVANTGKDTAKYVVSIVQMRMKDDGSFEKITTPDSGQYFADKYIRFFPRTVTLAPNESQIVKMQVNKADKLSPGEYRSHIYFRAVPKEKPLGEEEATKDTAAISVKLVPIFGITIPVIIRVGETSVKVNLSDLSLQMVNDTLPRLSMKFTRSGNISVYGDIQVDYISPQGKITKVSSVKGLAIYTPNKIRNFQCDLDKAKNVDYHKGKLHIVYSAPEDAKGAKIAEGEVLLH
jgi:P pilus assembly chaperone PapD